MSVKCLVGALCAVVSGSVLATRTVFVETAKPVWMYSTSDRTAEVRRLSGAVETVTLDFGWNRVCYAPTNAPGVHFDARGPLLPPEPARECETARSGRTNDCYGTFLPMTDAAAWRVEAFDAEARIETTKKRLLFGDGCVRVWYRKAGPSPRIRLMPARADATAPHDFIAAAVWIYGTFDLYDGYRDRDHMNLDVQAVFATPEGKEFKFPITNWRGFGGYWFQHRREVPRRFRALAKAGCVFRGFDLLNIRNADYSIAVDFNSFALVERDDPHPAIPPRPKRPVRLFDDQPQGLNTGAGTLSFPTTADTVVPPDVTEDADIEFRFPAHPEESWDDLAFRYRGGRWIALAKGGGVFPRAAGRGGDFRFRRKGNSVILDLRCAKDGAAERVVFGRTDDVPGIRKIAVPYYHGAFGKTGDPWESRPGVMTFREGGETFFVSATFDWYLTGGSEPFGVTNAPFGGMRYHPRSDGRRNPCYERIVWSVSRTFSDVLCNIPNPPARDLKKAGSHGFMFSTPRHFTRDELFARLRDYRRQGLHRMLICDHENMWRDYNESFTFKTNAAPVKGGDEDVRAFGRRLRGELGYSYGPYNNFSDLPPVNENFFPDAIARDREGEFFASWARCYLPRPAYAATLCERLCPVIAKKFDFDCCYSDVSTAYSPWERQDYDARVPGAATMAASFYAYGEIMRMQQTFWRGPTYSEGLNHAYYAGLSTGDFARDDHYFGGGDGAAGHPELPWLVDFQLLRIHPRHCGILMLRQFYGPSNRYAPKDPDVALDRFICFMLAFGHAPYVDEWQTISRRGYFMILPLSSDIAGVPVETIRYVDAAGRRLTTAEAIALGAIGRNQIEVAYRNGTHVAVNGSMTEGMTAKVKGKGDVVLPPNGYCYETASGARVFSGLENGRRVDRAETKDYVYFDGRADGPVVRLFGKTSLYPAEGAEEVVFHPGATAAVLPYAAARVVALDAAGREVGAGCQEIANGRTVLKKVGKVYSYRVYRNVGKDL